MKKSGYFLYLILFSGAVVSLIVLTRTNPLFYVDMASLLVILIFGLLVSLFFYGLTPGFLYFKAVFQIDPQPEITRQAVKYFKNMGAYTLAAGLFGFLTGMIAVLADISDTAKIGPNLAVALITMLYAVILNMVVFIPFRMILERKEK